MPFALVPRARFHSCAPVYTRPATTVGLASSTTDWPAGGQCHAWVADPALAVVKAVSRLTELCCGPCRYAGQSRLGPAACGPAAAAAAPWDSRMTAARPDMPASVRVRVKRRNLDIPPPFGNDLQEIPPSSALSMRSAVKPRHLPRSIKHVTVAARRWRARPVRARASHP